MLSKFEWIKAKLESSIMRYVLVKDFGWAMDSGECRKYLPSGFRHTFLLRYPSLVFTSYRKAMYKQLLKAGELTDDMKDEETFDIEKADRVVPPGRMFHACNELWGHVREHLDSNPIVID